MTYLRIKNWRRYQHYTNRRPPWLKLYNDLLGDQKWLRLTPFSRLSYLSLLMVASLQDNTIPANTTWIATEISLPRSTVGRAVKELTDAGLLQECASRDACKIANELESKTASAIDSNGASESAMPRSRSRNPPNPPLRENFKCGDCSGLSFKSKERLGEHRANVHGVYQEAM